MKFSYTFLLLIALRLAGVSPKRMKQKIIIFILIVIIIIIITLSSALISWLFIVSNHKSVTDSHARAMVEEVIWSHEHSALVGCGADARNVFGMGDMVEARGHPHHEISVHDGVVVFQVAGEVQHGVIGISLGVY